jgi:hypothetical protein
VPHAAGVLADALKVSDPPGLTTWLEDGEVKTSVGGPQTATVADAAALLPERLAAVTDTVVVWLIVTAWLLAGAAVDATNPLTVGLAVQLYERGVPDPVHEAVKDAVPPVPEKTDGVAVNVHPEGGGTQPWFAIAVMRLTNSGLAMNEVRACSRVVPAFSRPTQ